MAKFSRLSKLTKSEQEELLIGFCRALAALKTPQEAAQFLKDLLSKQEAEMLAKRIGIARLLIKGFTYEDIKSFLKVSYGTIARVSQWLATSGEGYRLIMSRVKEEKSKLQEDAEELNKSVSWKQIKRRHALYFWPDLILEEFVTSAKKQQKERMRKTLNKFDEKSEIFNKLQDMLREEYRKIK
jgi:TrpR-related protein YerC/YecD